MCFFPQPGLVQREYSDSPKHLHRKQPLFTTDCIITEVFQEDIGRSAATISYATPVDQFVAAPCVAFDSALESLCA